jgi:hypothetical protein
LAFRNCVGALEEEDSFRLSMPDKGVALGLHASHFGPGVRKDIHADPAGLRLVQRDTIQKGVCAVPEHDEQIGVAAGHSVTACQRAEQPDLFDLGVSTGQALYHFSQTGPDLVRVQPVDAHRRRG